MNLRWIALAFTLLLAGCGSGLHGVDDVTLVSVLASEDLAGPCAFEIVLAKQAQVQRGVIVVYERGDSELVFLSTQLRQLAEELRFSIVLARQCNGITNGDLQSKPSKGPGRVLFQALTQFASATAHPELADAGVILYGFSAAGVLSAEMASFAPNRVLGVIAYAAGSSQQNLARFQPAAAAFSIPSLFLANAKDQQSGTTRSLQYFSNGRANGAPWAYGVQQGEGHCCTLTTLSILIPWISGVVAQQATPLTLKSGTQAWFVCSPNGIHDAQHDQDCTVSSAGIGSSASPGNKAVWLPDADTTQEWLTWVTNTSQN